jgi:hypothetical protein
MSITSSRICAAADRLQGFVGFNRKTQTYLVRFSEDSFGLDVIEASITPTCEFVWHAEDPTRMCLKRARIAFLLEQNIDERLGIDDALRVYVRREDLPEICAERRLLTPEDTQLTAQKA